MELIAVWLLCVLKGRMPRAPHGHGHHWNDPGEGEKREGRGEGGKERKFVIRKTRCCNKTGRKLLQADSDTKTLSNSFILPEGGTPKI